MRAFKNILFVIFTALVVMQFFPPELNKADTTPPTDIILATSPPKIIEATLTNACYDCHSNSTRYPWYTGIEPVSYWFDSHIKEGKRHLDFSKWEHYSAKEKIHKLEEITEAVNQGWMPLKSYRWLHKDANLTQEEIKAITDWAALLQLNYQTVDLPQ
ncbi:heme-binding domain-containing protein [Galbibacter sp.]|uniref:heme-binding domain-containing protein n=1 Tax=Galbibacter sp. TaxID=2918471 RepID=UPI002CEF59A5|nr:heme-binding domain-containing protein [Galbibacter sp.]HLV62735.1 heme-binding domain-containing protein [Galbibacter sp.]